MRVPTAVRLPRRVLLPEIGVLRPSPRSSRASSKRPRMACRPASASSTQTSASRRPPRPREGSGNVDACRGGGAEEDRAAIQRASYASSRESPAARACARRFLETAHRVPANKPDVHVAEYVPGLRREARSPPARNRSPPRRSAGDLAAPFSAWQAGTATSSRRRGARSGCPRPPPPRRSPLRERPRSAGLSALRTLDAELGSSSRLRGRRSEKSTSPREQRRHRRLRGRSPACGAARQVPHVGEIASRPRPRKLELGPVGDTPAPGGGPPRDPSPPPPHPDPSIQASEALVAR